MAESVDEIVEGIPTSNSAVGCWAQSLTGDAAEFLAKVQAKERQLGKPLHRGTIIDKLREHFGVSVGVQALTRHLKDRCHCGQA